MKQKNENIKLKSKDKNDYLTDSELRNSLNYEINEPASLDDISFEQRKKEASKTLYLTRYE
jgi:hypothetical protein